MNRRVRAIVRHEFRATVGRRGFIITTALLPVLAILGLVIVGIVQAAQSEPAEEGTKAGYIDHSGLLEGSLRTEGVVFEPFADRAAGIEALGSDGIESLVEIPAGYLRTGQIIQIREQRGGIPGFGQDAPPIERLLVDALLSEVASPEVTERVRTPAHVTTLSLDEAGNPVQEPFDGARFLFFLVAAGLAFFATMMTSGYFQEGLSEEKENRIMEVLLSSSSPRDLLAGKFTALGALGLTQLGVWVLSLVALLAFVRVTGVVDLPDIFSELTVPSIGGLAAAVLLFVLGYALLGSMMGALGAITTSHREAQQVVFLLILPYLIPIWLWAPILENPEGTVSRVLSMIPFTAPITGMVRLGIDGIEGAELALSLGILSVAVVIAVFFTIRVFELSLLMYGQRPTVRQIGRAVLRGAG